MGRRAMSAALWVGRRSRHSACCTCDPDTLETPWKSELCAILHARDPAQASALLDRFMQHEEGSIRRVLARVRRVARLSSDDDGVALSYLGQALMKMISACPRDRKSTRLNSSHVAISYAVFC